MRRILYASFALPAASLVFLFVHVAAVLQFSLAALGLLPLAWLIGEATDQAGKRTGPVVGGLLNATFGNAVELFVSYFAIRSGEFEVVRGSLVGSVVSNALLVVGLSFLAGGAGRLEPRSTYLSLAQLAVAVPLLLAVALPYWTGLQRDSAAYAETTFPALAVLAVAYAASTGWLLRRQSQEPSETGEAEWSLRRSLLLLAVGVAAAGVVSEVMTSSIADFAGAIGVSVFFAAAVLVALAGNGAEHGSAILVSLRGNVRLGVEVALKSASQVAAMLIPAVAMLSWLVRPLPLSFRPVDVAVLAGTTVVLVAALVRPRAGRVRGSALALAYAVAVAAFFVFGD
jgi:Ca2+:H+ antiporter